MLSNAIKKQHLEFPLASSEFPCESDLPESAVIAAADSTRYLEAVDDLVAQADCLVRAAVLFAKRFHGQLQAVEQRNFVTNAPGAKPIVVALHSGSDRAQIDVP